MTLFARMDPAVRGLQSDSEAGAGYVGHEYAFPMRSSAHVGWVEPALSWLSERAAGPVPTGEGETRAHCRRIRATRDLKFGQRADVSDRPGP